MDARRLDLDVPADAAQMCGDFQSKVVAVPKRVTDILHQAAHAVKVTVRNVTLRNHVKFVSDGTHRAAGLQNRLNEFGYLVLPQHPAPAVTASKYTYSTKGRNCKIFHQLLVRSSGKPSVFETTVDVIFQLCGNRWAANSGRNSSHQ
ncbi:hypothetical protein [Rhizobium sp. PAMB 3182]